MLYTKSAFSTDGASELPPNSEKTNPFSVKRHAAMRPQIPPPKCTPNASSGSSTRSATQSSAKAMYDKPATEPTKTESHGRLNWHFWLRQYSSS